MRSSRLSHGLGAGVVLAAVLLATAVAAGAAVTPVAPAVVTQAHTGKTFRMAKARTITVRLSNRWAWTAPRPSTTWVELTPVEYLVDPGFREWRMTARRRGTFILSSVGTPACSDCGLAVRRFRVTFRVTP